MAPLLVCGDAGGGIIHLPVGWFCKFPPSSGHHLQAEVQGHRADAVGPTGIFRQIMRKKIKNAPGY